MLKTKQFYYISKLSDYSYSIICNMITYLGQMIRYARILFGVYIYVRLVQIILHRISSD